MKELRVLLIDGVKITDKGVGRLAGLTKLNTLGLSETEITDSALRHLSKLTLLKELYVEQTKVTCDGVCRYVPRVSTELDCECK